MTETEYIKAVNEDEFDITWHYNGVEDGWMEALHLPSGKAKRVTIKAGNHNLEQAARGLMYWMATHMV